MTDTATRFYTGIGSRETPPHVQLRMTILAEHLAQRGYVLRSGHADGADKAFERGAGRLKRIYLPWEGFNGAPTDNPRNYVTLDPLHRAAFDLARAYHPAFDRLTQGAQKLMARNGYQILSSTLDHPSEFLVCWTPDGCEHHAHRTQRTGGTGQAISIASERAVRIFNLYHPNAYDDVLRFARS